MKIKRWIAGFAGATAIVATVLAVPEAAGAQAAGAGKPASVRVKGTDTPLPPNARRLTEPLNTTPGTRGAVFQTAPDSHPQVVGGTAVFPTDYPSVVAIETEFVGSDNNLYWAGCTGTVLSPTKVLTAGHCTVNMSFGTTWVFAGMSNINTDTGGFVARVGSTWTDPTFNYDKIYPTQTAAPVDDVSVLTLKDTLPAAYVPVTLAAQGAADPAAGTSATIVGYGLTGANNDDYGVLRAAAAPIQSDTTCAAAWPGTAAKFDGTRQLCAGTLASGTVTPVNSCNGDSGGPIFTGAVGALTEVGITDWGPADCTSTYGVFEALNYYATVVKAQITQTNANNLDWSGDGHSDMLAVDPDTKKLLTGSGTGFVSAAQTGLNGIWANSADTVNWTQYTRLIRVNNWSGDGYESVFAVNSAGSLYNYESDGFGGYHSPVLIGSAWNSFVDISVTNNWTGNGLPNIMARKSNGDLYIYNSDGKGGWLNPHGTLIGTGWNGFNLIITPGSWLGDGHQSLIGRNAKGELWLYNSDGKGGWTNPYGTLIGTGWTGYTSIVSPGDWSGDGLVDLIGLSPTGQLRLYTTNGKGAWIDGSGRVIDSNWNYFTKVF